MRRLYKRVFARCYDSFQADYEKAMAGRRRDLLDGVGETVVEIGPGTGINLRYLPRDCRWIGVEPNPYMHDALRRRARSRGIRADLRLAGAEGIEVEDGVADVAISTLVLCSVPHVERTLAEIRRMLKPGGRFLFLEHVAAPAGTPMRRLQRALRPAWYLFGAGCRVDREIEGAIRSAGFASVKMESFRAPAGVPWVKPHIIGQALR